MQILDNNKCNEKTSVALGFFDGLHIAHKSVISKVLCRGNSAVLTFKADDFSDKTLMSDKAKAEMLENWGVKYLKLLDFMAVRNLSPLEFVEKIIIGELNAEFVSCGYNFRFGKDAQGTADDLRNLCNNYGIETEITDELDFCGGAVSTTRIKALMAAGKISEANELLGYRYCIEKEIIYGNQIGRKLNFPTVNQKISKHRFAPKNGVYASIVTVDNKQYKGVTNIGTKPTVSDSDTVLAETYIIGFDGDLYGKVIPVEPIEFIREEKKFKDVSSLAAQIECDRKKAISLLI